MASGGSFTYRTLPKSTLIQAGLEFLRWAIWMCVYVGCLSFYACKPKTDIRKEETQGRENQSKSNLNSDGSAFVWQTLEEKSKREVLEAKQVSFPTVRLKMAKCGIKIVRIFE